MKIEKKVWPEYFQQILDGKKTFELRLNDFVLCDKAYLSPKLAIELDDKSHERPDRQERDREVERILREAGVPLLRLENRGSFNPSELAQKIKETLNPKSTP